MLRAILAVFDPPVPPLTDDEREWLLTAAETRRLHQRRQAAIDAAIARVADESSARIETEAEREARQFWAAVEAQRQQPPPARAGLSSEVTGMDSSIGRGIAEGIIALIVLAFVAGAGVVGLIWLAWPYLPDVRLEW